MTEVMHMNSRKRYSATATRDGRWWSVRVDNPDTVGQARRLDEVEEVAREVIGLWFDVSPDSFDVDVTIEIPEPARAAWVESATREQHARSEEAAAAVLRREAVHTLRESGLTLAETSRVLGISPQRVHQLDR
ncbi:MAG: hypothetical protein JWN36_147 [Microbacteriaceae bacterium]|nr:hypothetical protein [Microbacteriaceae bacterium]